MNIAVLGASRGLGAALVAQIRNDRPEARLFLASRDRDNLNRQASPLDQVFALDFTLSPNQESLVKELKQFRPQMIFYVAGGGPYGQYGQKKWADHHWAFELNLLFPAKLLHTILTDSENWQDLSTITFVGSAIAGRQADPNAASYAAAKHGLRGLVESVQKESNRLNIRLFEPGYMDTKMLPPHAWPRQQGLVAAVAVEARNLWQLSQSSVD